MNNPYHVSPGLVFAFEARACVLTRAGGVRRVVCMDAHPDYPVVTVDSSGRHARTHSRDGRFMLSGWDGLDIVRVLIGADVTVDPGEPPDSPTLRAGCRPLPPPHQESAA